MSVDIEAMRRRVRELEAELCALRAAIGSAEAQTEGIVWSGPPRASGSAS